MLCHILFHRNYGKTCERVLQTMVMVFNVVVRSVKPHYRLMGFKFHGGGGQVGELNAPLFSQDVCLM